MSMSLALSICVLFISLMQLVNRAQFLIIIFFSIALLTAAPSADAYGTVIVELASIYASV